MFRSGHRQGGPANLMFRSGHRQGGPANLMFPSGQWKRRPATVMFQSSHRQRILVPSWQRIWRRQIQEFLCSGYPKKKIPTDIAAAIKSDNFTTLRQHHNHGMAEGSFTAKKCFRHRARRSPCAHSISKFFLACDNALGPRPKSNQCPTFWN